ncbi:hypothetical protein PBRA_008094 [Plasmodiophora brassicae]|nr:hypothetical protein PBRA_008094 [Plasmodiophora brassicae]
MRQVISILTEQQIDKYLLNPRRDLLKLAVRCDIHPTMRPSSRLFEQTPIAENLRRRLRLPFFMRRSECDAMENTLRYLLHHMRCGVYVRIQCNRLAMFVPFVNTEYRNPWSSQLKWDPRFRTLDEYLDEWQRLYHKIDIIGDPSRWWANGNLVCNVVPPGFWNGHGTVALRDMLVETCARFDVDDCEFFVNVRDHPQLKADLTDPFDAFWGSCPPPALPDEVRRDSYCPIVSSFVADDFADLPFPSVDDWELASRKVFPGDCRDLYTRVIPDVPWNERVSTAFFRGSATGAGVTAATNQRLQAALLSKQWTMDDRYNGRNPIDGVAFLDAGVTSWNPRHKKMPGSPLQFLDRESIEVALANRVHMRDQIRFKYQLYIAGHCAAARYSFLMQSGSVIMRCASPSRNESSLWFFPLLEPWVDHVPVAADLSDLAERIAWCKQHDLECERIVENCRRLYDRFISRNALMEYCCLVINTIAQR